MTRSASAGVLASMARACNPAARACEATALTLGEDGLYHLTVALPAGSYEYKVAMDGDWGTNYGSDGALNGPNYLLELAADGTVTFTYDPATFLVTTVIE